MKLVLFLFQDAGFAVLHELVKQGHEIQSVFTHPMNMDKNEKQWFKSIKEQNIVSKSIIKERIRITENDIKYIKNLEPDVILSVGWRRILPPELLKIPKFVSLNAHGSLLPKYKGFSPINWAILMGEKETGLTIHVMNEKIDSGETIVQKKIKILPNENAYDIYKKIVKILPKAITESLKKIKLRKNFPHRNLNSGFSVTRRFPLDGKIDWRKNRELIYNQIRALHDPFPNAFCVSNKKKISIKEAKLSKEDFRGMPGRICDISSNGVIVTCGEDFSKNQGLLITKIGIGNKTLNANEYFSKLWHDLK